jgi:hypothetical protein
MVAPEIGLISQGWGPGPGPGVAHGGNWKMKLTLIPSTGAAILVWREGDTYCARPAGRAIEPQVCLAVDLFEVIAELAGLDLEHDGDAAEAVRLSADAQQRLLSPEGQDNDEDSAAGRSR